MANGFTHPSIAPHNFCIGICREKNLTKLRPKKTLKALLLFQRLMALASCEALSFVPHPDLLLTVSSLPTHML